MKILQLILGLSVLLLSPQSFASSQSVKLCYVPFSYEIVVPVTPSSIVEQQCKDFERNSDVILQLMQDVLTKPKTIVGQPDFDFLKVRLEIVNAKKVPIFVDQQGVVLISNTRYQIDHSTLAHLEKILNSAFSKDDMKSARLFVQTFYNWYTPIALNEGPLPAVDVALREKPDAFSPELVAALREDSIARDKNPDYIVGLDYDPFLNTQDPCDAHEAGDVVQSDGEYRVKVFRICDGQKDPKPAVVVVLVRRSNHWVIINFLDPQQDGDLMNTLKLLKQERHESSHRGK